MTPRPVFSMPPVLAQRGFTLVEVVAFIAIFAVVIVGLITALTGALQRGGTAREINQAVQLAETRTELILGRKKFFTGFTEYVAAFDPCSLGTPEACTVPTGYGVTAGLAASYSGGDTNYRVLTVTVTGPGGGQLAEIQTLLANNES